MKTRILWMIPLLGIWALLAQIDCGPAQSDPPDLQADLQPLCSSNLWNSDMMVDMACVIPYETIQMEMTSLGCTSLGCHASTAPNKLKIDLAAGKLMDNYNSLFTSQLVVKGDPDQSTLITVPSTGKTATVNHVKTLTGTRLAKWRSWVAMGAPF